jgi:ferrochelatase
MRHGLLLINLGTPKKAHVSAVRNYLRLFLTDKRVIPLPALFRYILVYCFIVPLRALRTAHAYERVWTDHGSPLLYHSQNLSTEVQKQAGSNNLVALGMRYGEPSILEALTTLKHCNSITILPLYPQYSSAASGSSIEEVLHIISSWNNIPLLKIIPDFFQHPTYLKAQAALIKGYLQQQDHVLFSYHGLPERQVISHECPSICFKDCPELNSNNQGCYKAKCHQSSRLIAQELQLTENQYSTAFQSRLGNISWIKPYTEEHLVSLLAKGIKKLVIVCPSFVADCLETLEEIGIRAKQMWLTLGGKELLLVPSLNTHPLWIKAIIELSINRESDHLS